MNDPLEENRTVMRLIHMYKILEGLVPSLSADLSNTTTEFEEALNLLVFKTTSLKYGCNNSVTSQYKNSIFMGATTV